MPYDDLGEKMTKKQPPEPSEQDPNRYITYSDSDSGLQALEDDWHWHHDRRKAEGYETCPDCSHDLTSWWPSRRIRLRPREAHALQAPVFALTQQKRALRPLCFIRAFSEMLANAPPLYDG